MHFDECTLRFESRKKGKISPENIDRGVEVIDLFQEKVRCKWLIVGRHGRRQKMFDFFLPQKVEHFRKVSFGIE